MSKSWKRQRRERYMQFPEGEFREAVYSLAKSMQAQVIKIPQAMQDYVNHVEAVRRDVPKPEASNA